MAELEDLLANMRGQLCWSMIGPSAGSMFSLDFGVKCPRSSDDYCGNDKLRKEQREFRGEYSLFVRMTGWRIFNGSEQICNCNDSNKPDGSMQMGLEKLEGKRLSGFKFGSSPARLQLVFSEDYRLFLTDWEGTKPENDAYTLFGRGLAISVQMRGTITTSTSIFYP